MQRFINGLNDGIGLPKHVTVPESQDTKAVRSEKRVKVGIVGRLGRVLAAIQFDDDQCFQANEIADVTADRMLTPELETA